MRRAARFTNLWKRRFRKYAVRQKKPSKRSAPGIRGFWKTRNISRSARKMWSPAAGNRRRFPQEQKGRAFAGWIYQSAETGGNDFSRCGFSSETNIADKEDGSYRNAGSDGGRRSAGVYRKSHESCRISGSGQKAVSLRAPSGSFVRYRRYLGNGVR